MIDWHHPSARRSVSGRVAAIIRAIAARPDQSMTEVARCAELPVSTTHRLLRDLVAARLVQRGPEGRYRLGPGGGPTLGAAARPQSAVERCIAVRELVAAALDDLAVITGLRARFGVWQERGVSFLDRAGGRGAGVCVPGLAVVPVHATAMGRALLAHAPPVEVRRVLTGRLPAYTDDTVTTPDALAATLAAVRTRGVAMVHREWRSDESAVAVPVFGPAGVVAALELTGEAFPLAPVVPALVVGGRALGRRLADDPVTLPSGTGAEPLRWPVDPTAPALSLVDAAGSTA
jgi:DNA-binding IclR family transcriptional regulator